MHNDYLTNKKIETITEHVFGFEIKPETQISITNNTCNEHEETKWVSLQEALKLLKWNSNKTGFKILNEIITNQLNFIQNYS